MSDDQPSGELHELPEGLPWQVIYAAFLGILVCVVGFYIGARVLHGAEDAGALALGVAVLVVSMAIGGCFATLLAGASWALSVTRVATIAMIALMLGAVACLIAAAAASPKENLPGTRWWRLALDTLYQPVSLMLLAGVGVCAFLLCLLLGPTVRRFFGRS